MDKPIMSNHPYYLDPPTPDNPNPNCHTCHDTKKYKTQPNGTPIDCPYCKWDNQKTQERLAQSPLQRQEALAQLILRTHHYAQTIFQFMELQKRMIMCGHVPMDLDEHLAYLEKTINDEAQKLLGIVLTKQ